MPVDFAGARSVSLVDVVSRYVDLRQRGGEHVGPCPFHDDSDPSLTVYRGRDGIMRWRCFVCAIGGDVVDFVREYENCTPAEAVARITGGDMPTGVMPTKRELPPSEESAWVALVPAPDDAPAYDPTQTYNPRTYDRRAEKCGKVVCYKPQRLDVYRSESGRILCYVARLMIDGNKVPVTVTFCEGPGGERRWCTKRMPEPYPLQGLDELEERPGDHVLVVSGEKCRAAAAAALGEFFVVVSWLGGDAAVDKIDLDPLKGRDITLWPDADDSGRRAMARFAQRLGFE